MQEQVLKLSETAEPFELLKFLAAFQHARDNLNWTMREDPPATIETALEMVDTVLG